MSLLEEMLKKSTITNTKGGEYYHTTYNANLDMFTKLSRFTNKEETLRIFKNAYAEDKNLAVANLLFLLDIREGKGERDLFKTCFKWLCDNDIEYAKLILNQIGTLGRYDYILEGINTKIENEVLDLIKTQLLEDLKSEYPSLLAKWLPTRGAMRKVLVKKLEATQKDYRKVLSYIRKKINLVESKLCNKDYDIDFEKVPTKAMLKYRGAFKRHCEDTYNDYLNKAQNGEKKVNTKGLFAYEIISKIFDSSKVIYLERFNSYKRCVSKEDEILFDAMWKQQKDILNGYDKNILVMADTSASMTGYGNTSPINTSIGLALYIAERNKGAFQNYYMTFSSRPLLQKVTGNTIVEKVANVETIVSNTDIDEAFRLLLDTAKENKIPQEEMPSHIIIISDMEFDSGVYSQKGTNFQGWKKAFKNAGYELPKIVFWNVARNVNGVPVTKFDNDVAMITGFSTSIFENILNIENFTPENIMLEKLNKYLQIIENMLK